MNQNNLTLQQKKIEINEMKLKTKKNSVKFKFELKKNQVIFLKLNSAKPAKMKILASFIYCLIFSEQKTDLFYFFSCKTST